MKIIRLNEQQFKMFIEDKVFQMLNEKLGANIDVDILSKFLINYLKDKQYGQYAINKNQLPELENVKINKIIIDYNDKSQASYFDIRKSKKTNNNTILFFNIINNNLLEDIPHEVNHALQFFMLGKRKTADRLRPIEASNFSRRFIKKNREVVDKFVDILDRSIESEINSKVSGIYGELKSLLEQQGWTKRMIKNNQQFNNWFSEYIKNTDGYKTSIIMIHYNIFKEFDNSNLKGVDNYDKRIFFTIMEESKNYIIKLNLIDKIKYLWNFFKLTSTNRLDIGYNILTEEQVNSLMKKYQLFINKQGEKLRRKLFRLYDLFL